MRTFQSTAAPDRVDAETGCREDEIRDPRYRTRRRFEQAVAQTVAWAERVAGAGELRREVA